MNMHMIKAIALACVLTTPAYAQDATDPEICKNYAGAAQAIMRDRQLGYDINDVIEIVHDNDILVQITVAAYSIPVMQSFKSKQIITQAFASKIYVDCEIARTGQ